MSTPITVEIPHQLSPGEARRRIDEGFGKLAQQMSGSALVRIDRFWDGERMNFALKALGQQITGDLHILNDFVRIEIVLPSLLDGLAHAIRGRIQRQGQLMLTKK